VVTIHQKRTNPKHKEKISTTSPKTEKEKIFIQSIEENESKLAKSSSKQARKERVKVKQDSK
jgi:hypothetical protein